jgi:hypothetical protein
MSALRASARVAVLIGAVGSVGMTLSAGRQNPYPLLTAAFAIWVLSPFVLIILAGSISTRWSSWTRTALDGAALVVTLISLVTYTVRVLRPPRAQAAFVFVAVPPICWLIVAGAIAAALVSRRHRTS